MMLYQLKIKRVLHGLFSYFHKLRKDVINIRPEILKQVDLIFSQDTNALQIYWTLIFTPKIVFLLLYYSYTLNKQFIGIIYT